MTSTRVGGVSRMSTGTGSIADSVSASDPSSRRSSHLAHQQRMARAAQLEACRRRRSIGSTPPIICEKRARAWIDVELGGDVERALEIVGPAAERVGQRQQDAADLLGLLLLERDDLVVDLDRLERLEEQAGAARRAAVHDAGMAPRCSARTIST